MEEDQGLIQFPPDSDFDNSFTSTASSTVTFGSSSARSSLSLPGDPSLSSCLLLPHPHHRNDPHWTVIRAAAALSSDGSLHLRHLKVLRPLGSGNLARVFHCRLRDADDDDTSTNGSSSTEFALKVVDTEALARTKNEEKLAHVRTEGHVLSALDHPFLPTLYAHLEASRYTCFLIDYCPGGDLHALLRRQPGNRFTLATVRFYAAEVLLALEYLHALGFVYRDLKPENVLRRADGHVMLSDFDLCLQADVVPTLLRRSRSRLEAAGPTKKKKRRGPRIRFGSCFGNGAQETEELTEFLAEPSGAYSRECVGTHEYLAPEVVSGGGHGNGVDWWAFGVFVYELVYGRTPFRGRSKESTLRNIVSRPLRFPEGGAADDAAARDLIERLLVKDPRRRLGSARGATDIKSHPFFVGLDWPLIRCLSPPSSGIGGCRRKREKRRKRKKSSIIGKLISLGIVSRQKFRKFVA